MSEAAVAPGSGAWRWLTDASPAQVRAVLTPEAAGEFDRQWRAVMARATESLDLTELFQVLAGWRQVAQVTAELGHDGYRNFETRARNRMAARGGEGADAEVRTGVDEINALIAARLTRPQ
jgi:hypothetical protein